ncbi:FtsB family cell division protein [Ponticaulis koreensis]|uniref:FtsB family cell division protein n=1 Tax=Ponticaulis koreensis TaxID=1123045 RepID=UPI0003B7972D|nr:septum formation initiator family protein [Ponticaulis koreensis]
MKFPVVSLVLLGGISYLGYHAIAGQQGLSQWSRMQDDVRELEQERSSLVSRRDELSSQIQRLYSDSLDDDLIEELARQKFHFVYPNELILKPPELTSLQPENEDLFSLSN